MNRRRVLAQNNISPVVSPRSSVYNPNSNLNVTSSNESIYNSDSDDDSTHSEPIIPRTRRTTFGTIQPLRTRVTTNIIEPELLAPTVSDMGETRDIPEEDSDYNNITSQNTSIVESQDYLNVTHCNNKNVLTLEEYIKDDEPVMIYTLNSKQHFEKSFCITKEELTQYILPDNLMAIYTSPNDYNKAGYGSKPTEKIVFKLNYMYITIGSIERLLREMKNNKTWFALPLYGGKRRRIGNIEGIFGVSMNHGQIPGYLVYKLFTKDEIQRNVKVKESFSDYPTFFVNNVKLLNEIVGDVSIEQFAKILVKDLLFNVT